MNQLVNIGCLVWQFGFIYIFKVFGMWFSEQ